MTAWLTDNLPLLAGAPNGIKKLRELILELAVRGKLVEQDASDEPASELLKRIAAEKERLVADGELKKQKPLAAIDDEEAPFILPDGWIWVRLGQVTEASTGHAFKSSEYKATGTLVLRVTNINPDGTLDLSDTKYIDPAEAESTYQSVRLKKDEILLVMVGGSLGKIGIVDEGCLPAVLNQNMWKIFRPESISRDYLVYGLKLINATQLKITSSTHGHLAQGEYLSKFFPLAPQTEQHRIVAKVDELMALCDRLETQQADAASAHAQLVQALLGSLTQASDATEFAANWQRLTEHFHTLFSTEPSIDALKQTLLQLAVMGKLVPQDPSDESASELLRRVWEVNEKLERKLSAGAGSDDAESWFGISAPDGWCICKVSNIAEVKLGSTPSRAESGYWGGDIPWVSSGEVAGSIIKNTRERITLAGHKNSSTTMIAPGSVLIAMIGQGKTRGQSALLEIEACTNQNVAALTFNTELVASRYVWLWAQAMYSLHRAGGHGGAQPALNAKKVKAFSIPLPPTAEQHRIVAKVDQLMALCDQLKTQLSQARQLNQQLASTLVEQAVA